MMKLKSCLSLLTFTSLVVSVHSASAQTYTPSNRIPVADGTLNTQVSGSGNNFNITGGVTKGQTLFHSFTDFSVPTNGAANFVNVSNPRDIITRVTGSSFSDLNGLINTNGANFFLLNPNGIVFGSNVQLNVGKAFVASTANSLDLVDAGGRTITFGTNTSGDAPLLSVASNVLFDPARLNLSGSNGQISNFGLLQTANPGQYIGLIGGNVSMNGGRIQIDADGGRVELGGLAAMGTVTFGGVNNLTAQFSTNVVRGDVSLTNLAAVNVANGDGGEIFITARNVEILGKSSLFAGIFPGFGGADSVAGDIKVNATGDVTLADRSLISNTVGVGATGKGGAIEIASGNNLSVANALLATATLGQGDVGRIELQAGGDISFSGGSIASTVGTDAFGKGGAIDITAGKNISVTSGSGFSSSTFGQGDAGSFKIIAMGDVSFDGSFVLSNVSQGAVGRAGAIEITAGKNIAVNDTGLSTSTFGMGDAGIVKITAGGNVSFDRAGNALSGVEVGAVGNGGGIEITAGKNLTLADRSILTSSTFGIGDSGRIEIIVAGDFSVTNNSALFNGTGGLGNAGIVKIAAGGNVSFNRGGGVFSSVEQDAIGTGSEIEITTDRDLTVTNGAALSASTRGQGDAGSIKITSRGNVSFDRGGGVFSNVDNGAVGNGGGIEITTDRDLTFTNGGGLTSSSFGRGNAGNIISNANKIVLNNGVIFSSSFSAPGGNIQVNAKDYLLLRNNSQIATNSFSTDRAGNGGNITLGSPLIIAVPGNNDITANAFQGNGGRVNITSQGLFGIGFRATGTNSTNDITASSTLGQSGTVNITTPGADPGKDSTQLPNTPTDASTRISQACGANTRQNKLTVTGRGGLPPNANDPLTTDVVWQDNRTAKSQPAASSATTNLDRLPPPAVGWVFDGRGKVTLVAAGMQVQQTGTSVACPNAVENSKSK